MSLAPLQTFSGLGPYNTSFLLHWMRRTSDLNLIRVRRPKDCGLESTDGEQWRRSFRWVFDVRCAIICLLVSSIPIPTILEYVPVRASCASAPRVELVSHSNMFPESLINALYDLFSYQEYAGGWWRCNQIVFAIALFTNGRSASGIK